MGKLQIYLFKGDKIVDKKSIYIKGEKHVVYNGFSEFNLEEGVYEVSLSKRGPFHSVKVAKSKSSHISFDLKKEPAFLFKYDSFITTSRSGAQKDCRFKGQVKSFETLKPLNAVAVVASGTKSQSLTGDDGKFSFETKIDDELTLSFVHQDYRLTFKKVKKNHCDQYIEVLLYPSMGEMKEIVVLAPKSKGSIENLLRERKSSQSVSVFIGSEQFKKNGDSNAASALKRVSGLSLVEGRYVYIRGLGERYSSTNLNGASLPSPNPSRRVVPLDLFPTSLIESISIQKSYSVDKPAQFSAGLVEVRTLSIPKKSFFNFSVSMGASTQNILKGEETGSRLAGGEKPDFFGFDDGSRKLPELIKQTRKQGLPITFKDPDDFFGDGTGFTAEELSELGASFTDNYDFKQVDVGPNFGFSIASGGRLDLGVHKLGTIVKGVYSNTNDFEEESNKAYVISSAKEGLVLDNDVTRSKTSSRFNVGGQISLGAELFKRQKIDVTALATRSAIDNNEIIENVATANDEESFRTFKSFWEERELLNFQVRGEHDFLPQTKGLNLKWFWSRSLSKRYRPDEKEFLYFLESDSFVDRSFGNQRIYGDLNDKAQEMGLRIQSDFKVSSWLFFSVFSGARVFTKNRLSQTQRFTFNRIGLGENYSLSDPVSKILSHENIINEEFRLTDSTLATDSYVASENNSASYLNFTSNFKFNEQKQSGLSLITGFRYEDHNQDVALFDILTATPSNDKSVIEQQDFFYNYGAIYNINKQTLVTLAFSQTVTRPDLQEFAPVIYFNDEENVLEMGNPDLLISEVSNVDLRWDYYFNAREFLSVGYFKKDIKNPIESVAVAGTEDAVTFKNIDRAFNDGFEFEFRTHLIRNLFISGNYSYISSSIEINAEDLGASTNADRPLQGQSPYLVNLGLEYSSKNLGLDSGLSYNVAGRRIAQVGAFESPDIYEEPFHQLDFTIAKKISKRQRLGFKVQNILNSLAERTQGGLPTRSFKRGRRFSVNLSTTF